MLRATAVGRMMLSPTITSVTLCLLAEFGVVITRTSVLLSFRWSRLWFSHAFISLTHACMRVNAAFSSVGSFILNETYSWESSANVWKSSWWCLIICPMGPVYRINKTGPRTEPCGTPWSSSDGWDLVRPKQTDCVLEVRYDANHWWAMPITPALLIRPNSSEWSTVRIKRRW